MYKNGIWATQLINSQLDDGSWGIFHSMGHDLKTITTEKALRRLEFLGFTEEDEVIKKAIHYLDKCLNNELTIPDRVEKRINWNNFSKLMLSTWRLRYSNPNPAALTIAFKYKEIIEKSFFGPSFNESIFQKEYFKHFGNEKYKNEKINLRNFYRVMIVSKVLDEDTSIKFVNYLLNSDHGIYYLYDRKINLLPLNFKSKEASRYLSAIELLSDFPYQSCHRILEFVVKWLEDQKIALNQFDMGPTVSDGFFFPLSDSWRKEEDRIRDCSYRINKLLQKIKY